MFTCIILQYSILWKLLVDRYFWIIMEDKLNILLIMLNYGIFSSPGQRPCELLPSLGIHCPSSSVRPSYVVKLSHLNLLLWNLSFSRFIPNMQIGHILIKDHIWIFSSETAEPNSTKFGWDSPWVVPFQNYVRQLRPPLKMAAVTKNRNFFSCQFLLYYKSKWT
jgi:hypothetical protein